MRLRRIVTCFLLLLALVLAATPARAYPIAPYPLWRLVADSDLVVVAEVQEIRRIPVREERDGESWTYFRSVAVLRILESWKGSENGTIEVPYADLICPAPAVYLEGKDVLTFLRWTKSGPDGPGWTTVGLSYGTLYPDRAELADFREMVARAVKVQTKKPMPDVVQVEWLAEAASRPGTRWHGLYPLVPESDEIRYAYDRGGDNVALGRMLTPAQRERIARGFVESPPVDLTLPMALAVLADYKSPAVDEAAVSAMEGLFSQRKLPYWTTASLQGVLRRFEGDKAERRLTRLGMIFEDDYGVDEDEARAVWNQARRELNLPKVRPAKAPGREGARVGERTPP